ncbi:MAG: DUF4040 domain-containing protein [Elusimicrobia bacterium]|nr:DUF4040 domain-containing protein [Elusimicrobiota bacterium]
MALKFTLLFLLVVCAAAAVRMKDLLGAVIMLCAYSLIMTLIWTLLNAVDVALTEAAVGAGIVTVLLIAALGRTGSREEDPPPSSLIPSAKQPADRHPSSLAVVRCALPLLAVLLTGALLVYGTLDMPDYSAPASPANLHVASRYITDSAPVTGIVNFVTAILTGYRGFDTFGETVVIFAAAVGALLILGKGGKK